MLYFCQLEGEVHLELVASTLMNLKCSEVLSVAMNANTASSFYFLVSSFDKILDTLCY